MDHSNQMVFDDAFLSAHDLGCRIRQASSGCCQRRLGLGGMVDVVSAANTNDFCHFNLCLFFCKVVYEGTSLSLSRT